MGIMEYWWWRILVMMGLATPALVVAGMLQMHDELTLSPLPIVPVPVPAHVDQPATATAAADAPASKEVISFLAQPIVLDTNAIPRQPSDRLGGFIYEPVYGTDSDRLEYQLRSGLGLGVATDTAWSISHSVRLAPGLGLSVYYSRPIGEASRVPVRAADTENGSNPPVTGAGIRLEWKF
jgi:hypothetical protein